jgi:hypothetical protein
LGANNLAASTITFRQESSFLLPLLLLTSASRWSIFSSKFANNAGFSLFIACVISPVVSFIELDNLE